jgi:hypothetical protein
VGRKLEHTAGRSGRPKIAHRKSGINCTQGIPAGLPCGIPGIGELIEGAMQHAPHWDRHSMSDGRKSMRRLQRKSRATGHLIYPPNPKRCS